MVHAPDYLPPCAIAPSMAPFISSCRSWSPSMNQPTRWMMAVFL